MDDQGGSPQVRDLPKIDIETDTRDYLARAKPHADKYKDYFIVDVDAHVSETMFWSEVTNKIDSDVWRQMAQSQGKRDNASAGLLNASPGKNYQDAFGRIPHQQNLAEPTEPGGGHRQIQLLRRAMDTMGIDVMCTFPTPMLLLGMHPQTEVEVQIGRAYNRWFVEDILPQDKRIVGMLYVPFNDPKESLALVEKYADHPGIVGFMVSSTRYKPVYHDDYMPVYAAIQASGKPLGFHAGFHWGDQSMQQCNRFIAMHSISFVYFNVLHIINWIVNGLPERFPKLKVMWIESGLAWVPFVMQRLDSEYMMRPSEAPLLKRKPSEYIQDMFFTSQPLEKTNLKLLEATMDAMKAETQLLFASDWPHWDFDLPSSITTIPFLNEQAKRNILGLNAAKLFNLEVPEGKRGKVAASAPEMVPAK